MLEHPVNLIYYFYAFLFGVLVGVSIRWIIEVYKEMK